MQVTHRAGVSQGPTQSLRATPAAARVGGKLNITPSPFSLDLAQSTCYC